MDTKFPKKPSNFAHPKPPRIKTMAFTMKHDHKLTPCKRDATTESLTPIFLQTPFSLTYT